MKKQLTALLPIVAVVLLLLGGAPVFAFPSPSSADLNEINLTEADNGRRIELEGSQVLVLNLESNPSTGYGWEVQNLDQGILRQTEDAEWISGSQLLGAPGTYVLRFAGVAEGQTTVNLVYRRPWERDVLPAKTFSIEVQVVEPAAPVRSPESAPADELAAPVDGGVTTALPSSYNWCDLGACPQVRDQGACGSCWAFGTVGPFESALLISGSSRDLSEQYLVSCNVEGWGCNGGWFAHDYHQWKIPPSESAAGAVLESSFRYKAEDLPCNGPYDHPEVLADWAYVGNDSSVPATDAIKQAIYQYGPVGVAVCVDNAFQAYQGGVFNPWKKCNSVNHAVVLVGWDDADGAWILRNSWGSDWGENGYMRIVYGKSKVGYAANYVVYGETPPPPPPPPPEGNMHVAAIDMWYTQAGPNYKVYTRVTIVDENGNPVSDATVDLSVTLPSGSTASGVAATGGDGTVTFYVRSKQTGTYVSEVTNVTHASYTYDPAANVETSESLDVP